MLFFAKATKNKTMRKKEGGERFVCLYDGVVLVFVLFVAGSWNRLNQSNYITISSETKIQHVFFCFRHDDDDDEYDMLCYAAVSHRPSVGEEQKKTSSRGQKVLHVIS